jgi:hypothetical protein
MKRDAQEITTWQGIKQLPYHSCADYSPFLEIAFKQMEEPARFEK